MGILSIAKKNAVKAYAVYHSKKYRAEKLKQINKRISTYPEPIPELTEEEKEEITSFWKDKYGITFPLEWHRFYYGVTHIKDYRYVPEVVFHSIIKHQFNDDSEGIAWGDKAYMDFFLSGSKTVRSVVRNVEGRFLNEQFGLINIQEVKSIMDAYPSLVIKPTMETGTGKGVQLLHHPYDVDVLNAYYRKNYVIQLPLKQHSVMSKLNPSSINTIRVNSVLFETEAHVMSAFVKVGQTGEFADNHGHDRYFIGIHKDGTFCDYAINHDLLKFDKIPSGFEFAGQKVPGFDKVCSAIEEAHQKIAHFGFAFWDVCVDENGEAIIVEVNLRYPNTIIPQACGIGSYFGDYAEEILNRCRGEF